MNPRPNKKAYDLYFWNGLSFAVYIFLLPKLMPLLVPCLSGAKAISYNYAQCNILFVLDRYILSVLIGLSTVVCITCIYVSRYIVKHQKLSLKPFFPTMLTILICISLGITSYYLYIPIASRATSHAPIILESMTK